MNKITLWITLAVSLMVVPAAALAQERLDLGTAAPELSGYSLTGGNVALSQYSGKWVYVDFWASWCKPCMAELPNVIELQRRLGGQGKLEVLSVSLDNPGTFEQLSFAIDKFRVNYPVLYDNDTGNRHVAMQWGVGSVPATFLINPQGLIAARDIKVHEIDSFVSFSESRPYTPMRIRSSEELLNSSPSSGRSSMRDLRINLDIADSAPVSRYQLFVTAACVTARGQSEYYDVRYDLNISKDGPADFPFTVEIRKNAGDSYVNHDPAVIMQQEDQELPEMTVAIDVENQIYQFIVPVPSCSSDLGYAIALYDDRLGRFIRNGLSRVETEFDIGRY